jgi:phage shock protein C
MFVGWVVAQHGVMSENESKRTIDMDAVRETMARGVDAVHGTMARHGLTRPSDERVVGGVFSGIGRRFGLDPWTSRLAIGATLLVIPGTQILAAYPLLWAMMPKDEHATEPTPDPTPQPAADPVTA